MTENNVHKLKPYPFHAWTVVKNKLLQMLRSHDDRTNLETFLLNHVTEYGRCIFENEFEIQRMNLDSTEAEKISEYRKLSAIRAIAQKIYEHGAYSEQVLYSDLGDRQTTIRVLVMNFEKIMLPNPHPSEGTP